jgi:uncharacterized membrane protein
VRKRKQPQQHLLRQNHQLSLCIRKIWYTFSYMCINFAQFLSLKFLFTSPKGYANTSATYQLVYLSTVYALSNLPYCLIEFVDFNSTSEEKEGSRYCQFDTATSPCFCELQCTGSVLTGFFICNSLCTRTKQKRLRSACHCCSKKIKYKHKIDENKQLEVSYG